MIDQEIQSLTAKGLDALVKAELIHCPECDEDVHTIAAEGVPAQQLRACVKCEAVFFMDLNAPPRYSGRR